MPTMSFLVGEPARRAEPQPEQPELASPSAARTAVRRLRDPRMWIGVLLVATSATVAGRVLAAADDTVQVWSASRDLPVGAQINDADLVATSVHFGDAGTAESYVRLDSALVGQQLALPVGAGQLISRSAIAGTARPASEIPIGVAAADVPTDLAAGDRVDVWALPDDGQRGDVARVMREVRVVAVSQPEIAAAGGDREVLLAVDSPSQVAAALGGLAGARAVLVRVGG